MEIALVIVLGILAGAVSFLPLYRALLRARTLGVRQSAVGYLGPLLAAVAGSTVLLIAFTVICVVVAKPYAIPFVIAEGLTLAITAVVVGLVRFRSKQD
ncbi:MAG: hypothetical protein ACOYCA_03905 [Eggerthellaceae bacterium]|jgi:hypothetical protein